MLHWALDPSFPHALLSLSCGSQAQYGKTPKFPVGPPSLQRAAVHIAVKEQWDLSLQAYVEAAHGCKLPYSLAPAAAQGCWPWDPGSCIRPFPRARPCITLLWWESLHKNCLKVASANGASSPFRHTKTPRPPKRGEGARKASSWRLHTGFGFAQGCLAARETLTSGHVDKGNKGLFSCSGTEAPPTHRGCPLRHTTVHSAAFQKHMKVKKPAQSRHSHTKVANEEPWTGIS